MSKRLLIGSAGVLLLIAGSLVSRHLAGMADQRRDTFWYDIYGGFSVFLFLLTMIFAPFMIAVALEETE